jgi:perosamine synthetase
MRVPGVLVEIPWIIRDRAVEYTEAAYKNGRLSDGELTNRFERLIALAHTPKGMPAVEAVAVSSATTGLAAVFQVLAARLRANDPTYVPGVSSVIVPTNTFVASAAAPLAAGFRVTLADSCPVTGNLTKNALAEVVAKDPAAKAVVYVPIGGSLSPEIEQVRDFCVGSGLDLIIDAAHAHGCSINNRFPPDFARAAVYSYYATKVLTCGEGGMVLTRDAELARAVQQIRNHGKSYADPTRVTSVGTNYRMSEAQAALGLAYAEEWPSVLAERTRVWRNYLYYLKRLSDAEIYPVIPSAFSTANHYKITVRLPPAVPKEAFIAALENASFVGTAGGTFDVPLHEQPALKGHPLVTAASDMAGADEWRRRHVCLPIYLSMREEQVAHVCESVITTVKKLTTERK